MFRLISIVARARGREWLSAFICLPLVGCTPGMGAAVDSVLHIARRGSPTDDIRLDPAFPYLRTTMGGSVGFAWLGNTEQNEHGPVEAFYSRSGEMIRLQNGRILTALGFTTEWRKVDWPQFPGWSAIANAPAPTPFVRVRDVMPGYRTGLREAVTLRRIDPPGRSALRGVDPATLAWFEERVQPVDGGLSASDAERLPPAKYAVEIAGGKETVVYSEQCLAKDFCFTWQRWSAAMQEAQKIAGTARPSTGEDAR